MASGDFEDLQLGRAPRGRFLLGGFGAPSGVSAPSVILPWIR
jgi:hypothetical protein